MDKKIKEIKEEFGYVTINLKGTKQKVASKTILTYYEDGTNDCVVQIQKPLDLFAKEEKIGGVK